MAEEDEHARGADDYGVGRLLALSDGVFGIAMTLLVLDIAVVPPPPGAGTADGLRALGRELPALGIYAFSFAMVAIHWLNHHRGLRTLRVATRRVLFRNLGLLGLVCLMPFATAFFNRFSNTTAGNQVYLGALFLLGLMSTLTVPWRDRALKASRGPGGRRHAAAVYLDQVGPLPVFLLGFVLAFWIPDQAGPVVLGLILLLGAASWVLRRGRRERLPTPDHYGVGRMLALSDGVFAIALTLLVLNIAVPRLGSPGTQTQALALLASRRGHLVAFGISFLVVGIYWVMHHRSLRTLTSVGHNILRRNLVFLCAVCLVPFATNFFGEWEGTVFGNQFFFASFGVLGLLSTLVGPWLTNLRAALREGWRSARVAEVLTVTTGTLPVSVIGIALAPALGDYAQLVWLLMIPVVQLRRVLPGEGGAWAEAGRR